MPCHPKHFSQGQNIGIQNNFTHDDAILVFFETTICSIFWLHIIYYQIILLLYSFYYIKVRNINLFRYFSYLNVYDLSKLSFEKISLIAMCLLIWFSIKKNIFPCGKLVLFESWDSQKCLPHNICLSITQQKMRKEIRVFAFRNNKISYLNYN